MHSPMCASAGVGCVNGDYVADACCSGAMDPQFNFAADSVATSASTIGCCSSNFQNFVARDNVSYPSSHSRLPYGSEFPTVFQQCPYTNHGQDYTELQRDSNWDRLSEGQLESILMNMLDGVYKDAVKKIVSFNFTQEEALNAVLRKGRWNKRDALTSIVENALAWLHNSEARSSMTDLVFTDLQEMEVHVLAEMISVLRKVRPYLSKGDCMWSLLMCDLNVLLACAMDEDSVPLVSKAGSTSNAVLSQTMQPTEWRSSDGPPMSTMTRVPSPQLAPSQQMPCTPQPNVHSSRLMISSRKESRSAFSPPSFSSSPVGKVAVASRKGPSSKPPLSIPAEKPNASLSVEVVNAHAQKVAHGLQGHQAVFSEKTPQLSVSQLTVEDHAMKLGLYISNANNGLAKFQSSKPDNLVQRVISSDGSPQYPKENQTAVLSTQSVPQPSDVHATNFSIEQSTSLQPGITGSKLRGSKVDYSSAVLPDDHRQLVQSNCQTGSIEGSPGYHHPEDESWTLCSHSCKVENLGSSGAELSLATSSFTSLTSTEFSGDCQIDRCVDESHVACFKAGVPVSQMLGCNGLIAEERKTVLLWQLVDCVKYLEAQLQEWTDWAQEKVMQATRRLTKDTSELKALRRERDEYIRLKKEKHGLEESTMKKLAEMEASLGKALNQVDRANSTARRLESENALVRAELEAARIAAAESVHVCQEASKREEKSIKKAQGWEKQKLKLREDLIEGKKSLSHLLEQVAQARERLKQVEVRWRQEKKSKEEAQLVAEIETRAKESGEHSVKSRDEALQRKSEVRIQRYQQEMQNLESEISKIKLSMGLQPTVLDWENSYKMVSTKLDTFSVEKLKQINARLQSAIADLRQSPEEVHQNRECMMCTNEKMSVVFLPCAHQVICVKCSESHQRKGLTDCPSCRAPIQQRIPVYGVRP